MSYSCVDFTDSILDALGVVVPLESQDCPEDQANIAVTEIDRLQKSAAMCGKLIAMLDRVHQILDTEKEARYLVPLFDEIGCLIAEARGEYDPNQRA
jgi:hypothetical protein